MSGRDHCIMSMQVVTDDWYNFDFGHSWLHGHHLSWVPDLPQLVAWLPCLPLAHTPIRASAQAWTMWTYCSQDIFILRKGQLVAKIFCELPLLLAHESWLYFLLSLLFIQGSPKVMTSPTHAASTIKSSLSQAKYIHVSAFEWIYVILMTCF